MFLSIALFGVDPSSHLGRIDKASLPQQALMEMLIDGLTENKEKICGKPNEIKDISAWRGLSINENGEVAEIKWGANGLEGSLNLGWLPPTVGKLFVPYNKLTGSIHLQNLPKPMKYLCLSSNRLSGEIDLGHLPEEMEELQLTNNQLSGNIDLTRLPVGMKKLFLSGNNFTGETDFSKLPKSLKCLF